MAGIALDTPNTNLSSDADDPTRFPRFRTSGVLVEMGVEYSNLDRASGRPSYYNEQVSMRSPSLGAHLAWAQHMLYR